jgi:integrase
MTLGMGRPKTSWIDAPPRMTRRPRRKGGFHYYYQAAGKKTPLGTNLITAKEEWARLESNGPKVLFPHVARLYRDAFKDFAASTRDHYERALRNLEVYFRKFTLEQMQPRHVKMYLRKRSKKGAAMFEKRVGSAMFNWARGEGHTSVPNPFHGITFSKAEKRAYQATGRRKVYVTDTAYREVWGRGDDVLQDAMDLAYRTGQRPGDILKARRQDIEEGVEFEGRRVRVLWFTQEKTEARVGVIIEGELERVLERILGRSRPVASVYLIADRRGQRVLLGALNVRFRKARGEATWQFRDIRAKTASDMPDLKKAQLLLGHAQETTTVIYRRSAGDVVAALDRAI